jgi:hypothetical protein
MREDEERRERGRREDYYYYIEMDIGKVEKPPQGD